MFEFSRNSHRYHRKKSNVVQISLIQNVTNHHCKTLSELSVNLENSPKILNFLHVGAKKRSRRFCKDDILQITGGFMLDHSVSL